MKTKILLNATVIVLFLLCAVTASSQTQNPPPPEVNCVPSQNGANGEHDYSVLNLSPSQPGATFSYLWWFGDNSFGFSANPTYMHSDPYYAGNCDMMAVVTENYGTSGPPPLPYNATTYSNNGTPFSVLGTDTSIYMQNYREAVLDDTMYLIVTYRNDFFADSISGELKLVLDPNLTLLETFIDLHPEFYPNQEVFYPTQNKWKFNNLGFHQERSILIPVKVNPNTTAQEVTIKVLLQSGYSGAEEISAVNMYEISADIALCHDPNLMVEKSDAENNCAYGGEPIDYTIKFQNVGEAPTRYVKVKCFLDDRVDLNTITNIEFPSVYDGYPIYNKPPEGYFVTNNNKEVNWEVDHADRTITFEMNKMVLRSVNDPTCTDLETTRDQVSFRINVEQGYVFGDPVIAYSEIIFNDNAAINTDSVLTNCKQPVENNTGRLTNAACSLCKFPCWIWLIIGFLIGVIVTLILVWFFKRSKRKK